MHENQSKKGKGQLISQNPIYNLYKDRKRFNKYVTQLLGKDTFLHQISQNSYSSQNSETKKLSNNAHKHHQHKQFKQDIYNDDYKNKQEKQKKYKKQRSNAIRSPNTDKWSRSIIKPNHQKIVNRKNDEYNKQIQDSQTRCRLFKLLRQKVSNMQYNRKYQMFNSLGDQQFVHKIVQCIIEYNKQINATKLEKQHKDSLIQIDGNMSSFYNMQIDQLKQKYDNLKQINYKLQKQLLLQSQTKQKTKKYTSAQKLLQIRAQQIDRITTINRQLKVTILNLSNKLKKYRQVIFDAKKLNEQFLDKFKSGILMMGHNHNYSNDYMIKNFDKNKIVRDPLKLQNSRFQFIRARSQPKFIK